MEKLFESFTEFLNEKKQDPIEFNFSDASGRKPIDVKLLFHPNKIKKKNQVTGYYYTGVVMGDMVEKFMVGDSLIEIYDLEIPTIKNYKEVFKKPYGYVKNNDGSENDAARILSYIDFNQKKNK